MIVRIAEAAGLELVDVDVEPAGLARIAKEIDLIGGDPVGRVSPFELLRRHKRHSRRIELDSVAGGGEARDGGRNGKHEVRQRMLCDHWFLPLSTPFLDAACMTLRSVRGAQSSLSVSLSKAGSGAVYEVADGRRSTSPRKRTTASLKMSGCSMFEMCPACSIARKREPVMAACISRVFSGGAPWSSLPQMSNVGR